MERKWGFLRETDEQAKEAGIDKDTGLHRTGLEVYLQIIFPQVDVWLHDKTLGMIDGINHRSRPDYRSEQLKLIVEFDGLQHYTKPDIIEKDLKNTERYTSIEYKVVRIPYFIQLSHKAVKTLFDVTLVKPQKDKNKPFVSIKNTYPLLGSNNLKN